MQRTAQREPLISWISFVVASIVSAKYFLSNEWLALIILVLGVPAVLFAFWQHGSGYLGYVWPLWLVFAIGNIGVWGHSPRDVFRDQAFALSAICLFSMGYVLGARTVQMWRNVLKVLVLCGFVTAFFHILEFAQNISLLKAGVNELRDRVSFKTVHLVVISLCSLLLVRRVTGQGLFPFWMNLVFGAALFCSAILSFSRTGLLVAAVTFLALFGWISRIRLIPVLIMAALVLCSWLYLKSVPEYETESFRGKLAHSLKEVSMQDYSNERDINENWRGFETHLVLDQYKRGSFLQKTAGQGFGTLVDLGFYIKLGGEEMRHIPVFHNGYAYVLLKCGAAGFIAYLIFFINLWRLALGGERASDSEVSFAGRLLLACILSLIVTMVVVGGMPQLQGVEFVLLAGILCGFLKIPQPEADERSSDE